MRRDPCHHRRQGNEDEELQLSDPSQLSYVMKLVRKAFVGQMEEFDVKS